MLVEAGADVSATDDKGDTCLTMAAHHGHTETVRYIVGLKDVDVKSAAMNDFTALHKAVDKGHVDVVQVLIDAGAEVDAKNKWRDSPLHLASKRGNMAIVKMLVEAGAEVSATDNKGATCLTMAVQHWHTETVRYLVGLKDVDVNSAVDGDFTALHWAITETYGTVGEGRAEMVQVLIDAGADVDTEDNTGRSPLHLASREGNMAIVKMLVEAGADVSATDNEGDTCLAMAAQLGHTETVRYLVGLKDVDVSSADQKQLTALHKAVDEGHVDVVQVLIDAGADVDAKNDKGRTPLHLACENENMQFWHWASSGFAEKNIAILKMLVEAGADVSATDNDGDTCLGLATKDGYDSQIVRYLANLPKVDVKQD